MAFSLISHIFCFISLPAITMAHSEDRRQFLFGASQPEAYQTSMDMMVGLGYSVAWYTVQTPDRYLLEIHRMPAKRYSDNFNIKLYGRYPVLLVHGLLCSSAEYTNNFPDQSLGYQLADAGYDVWMINFRGNAYSRRHLDYQPSDPKFWDWSWQHMADYDLPSVIDFVLAETRKPQLYIVGHSMGTTIPFAMLSTMPAYNLKVRAYFALSPVVYLRFARGLINILALLESVFRALMAINFSELLPQSGLMQAVANTICNSNSAVLCETAINLVFGDQPGCLNRTRLPVYLSHFPAGTSMITPVHFFQVLKSGTFGKFDLGLQGNLAYYGTSTPPVYNLNKITTYVNLYYIDGDYVSNYDESSLIYNQLTGAAGRWVRRLAQTLCGHLWLVWGLEMGRKGNSEIIRLMEDDYYRNIYPPRTSG